MPGVSREQTGAAGAAQSKMKTRERIRRSQLDIKDTGGVHQPRHEGRRGGRT
jgi:hypothetical protein